MPLNSPTAHQYKNSDECIKAQPQLRLTVDEVMQRRPYMRCDQYLADVLSAMKKIGFGFRIQVSEFAEKIGLNIRTFQRARRLLIDSGRLIENRLNRDSIELFLVPNDDKSIAQDDKPIVHSDNPIAQDDNTIAITPPKPTQQATFENPSTLITTPYTTPLSDHEGERDLKKPIPKNEEIAPDYWEWLEAQALKMPRAIANIPVWIRSTAKKSAWMQTYADYVSQKAKCSVPSPSTNYFEVVEVPAQTAEELAATKEAILKARQSLNLSAPAPSKFDRLPSIESFKSLGLGSI